MKREYPDRPFAGVGGVIVGGGPGEERRVVLIRRGQPPLQGEWSLPGGAVEIGETLEECLRREVMEETGLEVEVGPVVDVFDRITYDEEQRVQFHYVLIDYLCRPVGGRLQAGSDVDAAVWAGEADLSGYGLAAEARAAVRRALHMAGEES